MLQAIHRKYPNNLLQKGGMVLMGTPGGVASTSLVDAPSGHHRARPL